MEKQTALIIIPTYFSLINRANGEMLKSKTAEKRERVESKETDVNF